VEKSFQLNSGRCIVPICLWLLAGGGWEAPAQSPLPGAVGQQAVTDAAAQQERERQRLQTVQPRKEESEAVTASEVSPDLGSLQIMRERPDLPFFRVRADQTYNWLSNANYAKQSANAVAAWQAISSLEAAWAPTFSTLPGYEKFYPEAGIRTSFFNYFQQEEPANTINYNKYGFYDMGLVQDFVLVNLFLRTTKQVTEELSVGLSFDYNGYFYLNSPTDRAAAGQQGQPTNFLNEYALAYSSGFIHPFHERIAMALNWRSSYVFANSPGTSSGENANYQTRTDNSLGGSLFLTLSDRMTLTPFASYRLAYYTDAKGGPTQPNGYQPDGITPILPYQNPFYRRLDQQYTLGLAINFLLSPELSTGLNLNYSQSNSTSKIAETGDFSNLTAGANWSMTYKFSEKEFVVTDPADCLGPFVRTDLGFAFDNNLNSSQSLSGELLPGVTGNLSNPSIAINPGVRFDVTPGYNFTDWLGVEFSAGILYNGLDHLNGSGSLKVDGNPETFSLGDGGIPLTGRLVQVPALLSSVFRWPGKGRWKPYLSTGFGFAYSQLQITQVGAYETSDQFAQQFSPAFSVGSGFYWQVSDMVDFDVMYKLLGLVNPGYSGFHPGVPISNSLQFGMNIRF